MPTVMLPGLRGIHAKKELLKHALKLKKKYDIRFSRDAVDEYEAIYGVLLGLEQIVEELMATRADVDKVKAFVDAVISEKGIVTAEGVYVWPKHMKDEAEELGIDWEEFKKQLKEAGILEFDQKKKKYKVKI